MVLWCGEEGVRVYACGMGETRSSRNLLLQVALWADPAARLRVVHRMYRMRFAEEPDPAMPLEELRGREGIRVREAYARLSRETGVAWEGRSYRSSNWRAADPVNRALSCANSCLYGVCHAAIVSAGFSPALGFIHTGKALSFVYDVADLYKVDLTIPLAFRSASEGPAQLETRPPRLPRFLPCGTAARADHPRHRTGPWLRARIRRGGRAGAVGFRRCRPGGSLGPRRRPGAGRR